jgi:hypothetical protein
VVLMPCQTATDYHLQVHFLLHQPLAMCLGLRPLAEHFSPAQMLQGWAALAGQETLVAEQGLGTLQTGPHWLQA